jgi:hypothetical protein
MLDRRRLLLSAAVTLVAAPACAAPPALAITVYKDPYCGCCTAWAEHLKASGFNVTVEEREDMAAIKTKYGVPDDLTSCHTAVIAGYAIEGHVPGDDIKRFVSQHPAGRGLAVPGMPVNSPGMEVPGEPNERYTVWLFQKDGSRAAFARHGG